MAEAGIAFGRIAATLAVRDLDRAVSGATALHDHLVAQSVPVVQGLRDADHGLRGFVFADPDGNRIDVGQEL